MNEKPLPNDEQIDALVRAHLHRAAERVDAAAFLERLRPQSVSPRNDWRRVRRWAFSAAAAVFIVTAFFVGSAVGPPARASAETIVRDAQRVHALPTDRCYLVQVTPAPGGLLERQPHLIDKGEKRLWTRGDRFWIESTNPAQRWKLGRDDQGRLWIALGKRQGLRVERDEFPDTLAVQCDVLSMQVETLLREVLTHFDLRREERPGTYVIHAEPRPGDSSPRLLAAVLEIDAETKVVKRLVLQRAWQGRPTATTTFTLIDTTPQLDASYQLEGHIEADAPVFTRDKERLRRARLLRQYFGIPAPG